MCAFRHGMIKDAHDALVDIQSSGRSKETFDNVLFFVVYKREKKQLATFLRKNKN